MRRRDISRVLLASATGAAATAVAPSAAQAQTCTSPCYPQTAVELAAGITPTNTSYLPGDIRRYGALVDGSTDDAAANQKALKLSATYPMTVPGGTSIVGTTLTAPSGSRIVMDATAVLKAKSTLVGPVLYLNTIDNSQIRGGKIDGSDAGMGTYGLYIYQSTNVAVNDLWVTAAKGNGVEVDGTSGTHCTDISLSDCRLEANFGSGITFTYTDDFRMEDCYLKGNSIGMESGACTRVAIVGCQAFSNTNDGIAVGDSCAFVTISGCTSAYNGAEGINIDGCTNSTISGNTSYQNLIGISCWNRSPGNSNAGHNAITGNTVRDCYLGIILADSQANVAITGNVVRTCGANYSGTKSGSGNHGLYIQSCDDFNVTGNMIANNTYDGIYVNSAVGGQINSNYIISNGHYGIELEAGSGIGRLQLSDNTIKTNGDGVTYKAGLYNRASSNVYACRNLFIEEANPGTQQVPIDGSTGASIYDSNIQYSVAGQILNITAGRQTNNSWNYNSASPTVGTWALGDIVWNSAPVAAGVPGWICTTAGSPGVWKAMAAVA